MKRVWKLFDIKHFTKPHKTLATTTVTAAATTTTVTAAATTTTVTAAATPTTTVTSAATTTTENKPLLNSSNQKLLSFIRELWTSESQSTSSLSSLFTDKSSHVDTKAVQDLEEDLKDQVSVLRNELVDQNADAAKIDKVLDEKGAPLFRNYSDTVPVVIMLLNQLNQYPVLALEVINWRRRQIDVKAPILAEEYAKGIMFAGRLKDLDLANELFSEACNRKLKKNSIYNALMSAYMYNGCARECQSLFHKLKSDQTCTPTIVTYNILLSVFGRLMLIDQMDSTFREMKDLNLSPNVRTYNTIIAGYVTAWMWDSMEKTYSIMLANGVKPDINTHLLMLRGYAHSGNIDKMQEVYELVKDHVKKHGMPLIRAMICAYCESSYVDKVTKIEELLKLIPENEFKPWLNVRLICLYAKEDMLEEMENSIQTAFERNTYVTTTGVMRRIIASYFRQNAIDNLANFVSQAEFAGWKICRSLYHCKMVMYSLHSRISDMENVLDEMDRVNINCSKGTLWILYCAYAKLGQISKVKQVMGVMCKQGCGIPMNGRSYL